MSTHLRIRMRPMAKHDIPAVLTIEHSVCPFPLNEDQMRSVIRSHLCDGAVAECDANVLGFVIYRAGKFEIEILDLCVSQESWRQGVGSQIIGHMKNRLGKRTELT